MHENHLALVVTTHLMENYPRNTIMNFVVSKAVIADYSVGWVMITPDSRVANAWIFRNIVPKETLFS